MNDLNIVRLIGRLAICWLGLVLSLAQPAAADTIEDYLVQQVCDDGSGGHTSADPVTCPGKARKLRIGEALPYHKWDIDRTTGQPLQIGDSYPIKDLFGRTRVVHTMYFDSPGAFVEPYFDTARSDDWRAAYDLMIADGNYVSIGGTYNPGRGWQPFWSSSSCSYADSWVHAPKALAIPFTQGQTTSKLTNRSPQCPPVSSFSTAFTVWNFYPNLSYESGKALNTIKSWHFGGKSVNAVSIEVFYFTKEYGRTRWESWTAKRNVDRARIANAAARCPTGTNGGTVVFGRTTYRMVDCHDWSHVIPAPNGDWDPAANWHIDPLYHSINLLRNTHMRCTDGQGKTKDCNHGGACRVVAPWNTIGPLNLQYDVALQGSTRTANCALRVSFSDPSNEAAIYQDQPINRDYSEYGFGTALWLPEGGAANATITVFQLDRDGRIVSRHDAGPVTVGPRPKFFQSTFIRDPATATIRFQISPQTQNAVYQFTESWVAPIP
jgi:hypothetical protein